MIKHLELKNFTAFRSLSIEFSPGINIIIGANNTGKTHLLKLPMLSATVVRISRTNRISLMKN